MLSHLQERKSGVCTGGINYTTDNNFSNKRNKKKDNNAVLPNKEKVFLDDPKPLVLGHLVITFVIAQQ